MLVLCCYHNRKVNLAAVQSIGEYAPETEMVNVTGDFSNRDTWTESMSRYWWEVRSLWKGVEDLVLLSERRAILPDTIEILKNCPSLVCYYGAARKYSAKLQRLIPASTIGGDYMIWHSVNPRLAQLWEMHKIDPCFHRYNG